MPPKSSSATRRRATRSTARKRTPVVNPCSGETTITNSPSDAIPNISPAISADEDVSVSATASASPLSIPISSPLMSSTIDSTEYQFSTPPPLQAASVSTGNNIGESIDTEEPLSDAVLGNQTASIVAEGDTSRQSSADAVQKDGAESASCEANPKTGSETNVGFLSPQAVQYNVEDDNDRAAVTRGQNSSVEVAASKDVAVNSGGKAKKIVKKTVKVVKKVIKKVPKRVVKGESDAKVDEVGKPDEKDDGLNQSSGLDSTVLNEVERENVKAGVTVSLNVEYSNGEPVERAQMEIVEEKKSSEAHMEVDKKGVENAESASKKVDDKDVAEKHVTAGGMNAKVVDKDVNIVIGGGEAKGRDELELDNHACKPDYELEIVEEKSSGAHMEVGKREAENVESASMEVDKNEDDLEGHGDKDASEKLVRGLDNHASKPEYELEGEGKLGERVYISGELEAIERRKRRKTEIFIGGLDKDVKEEDIRKVFEEIGEVMEVRVLMDGKTGKNKGYAFLRYASAVDAKRALEKFSKVEICGKQCGAAPVEGNDTIYLGHIDKKWKEDDVLKLLQEAGIEKIDKVNIMIDPNNLECNRGYAFVEMETSKDAQIAYKKLQKKDAFGKNHKIKVAWAEPLKEVDEEEILKVKTVYAEFIPLNWDEEEIRENFKKFGEIDNIILARNLRTAKRKDFAFISYKTREAAITCIESFSRELASDDGTKVNIKVSLAKPIPKGKQPKPVAKAVSKEIPREKPKARQGNVRPFDPQTQGRSVMHHHDNHRAERPSTNAELVSLLREQASWSQLRPSMSSGPVDIDYANTLSGRKRPLSMLDADPLYSHLRYARSRVETSFPFAGSSYNSSSPIAGTTSSAYYQGYGGYTSGLLYGTRNPGNEVGDRADERSTLYRRY